MELIKEAFPELQGATVLWDQTTADQWRAIQSAAAALGIPVTGVELIEQPYDYERAFSQTSLDHRRPLYVVMSGFFFRDRERLANFALQRRVPSIFGTRERWRPTVIRSEHHCVIQEGRRVCGSYCKRS